MEDQNEKTSNFHTDRVSFPLTNVLYGVIVVAGLSACGVGSSSCDNKPSLSINNARWFRRRYRYGRTDIYHDEIRVSIDVSELRTSVIARSDSDVAIFMIRYGLKTDCHVAALLATTVLGLCRA